MEENVFFRGAMASLKQFGVGPGSKELLIEDARASLRRAVETISRGDFMEETISTREGYPPG